MQPINKAYREEVKTSFFDDIPDEEDEKSSFVQPPLWLSSKKHTEMYHEKIESLSNIVLIESYLYHQDTENSKITQIYYVLFQDRLMAYTVKLFF